MPQMLVDFNEEESNKLTILKAIFKVGSKEDAIKRLIQLYKIKDLN